MYRDILVIPKTKIQRFGFGFRNRSVYVIIILAERQEARADLETD